MEKDDERTTIPTRRIPLGMEERLMMLAMTGLQKPLEYPRRPMKMADGQLYEEYDIPEADRRKVLEELYPFDNIPAMDDLMLDIHTQTKFKVSEYKAIRQNGGNFIVAPLYAQYGGTLLDWLPVAKLSRKTGDDVAIVCVARVFKGKDGDAE